jgi:hypothetical protein
MNPKNAHGVSEFDFLRDHQASIVKPPRSTSCAGSTPVKLHGFGFFSFMFVLQ